MRNTASFKEIIWSKTKNLSRNKSVLMHDHEKLGLSVPW